MKTVQCAIIAAFCAAATFAFAADAKDPSNKKQPAPAQQSESQIIAKVRESYPLKACVVSDEALGNLSEATAHVHRTPGKRDRVIFVCCEGCIDDFKKDPAKYLAKLDAAEAARKKK